MHLNKDAMKLAANSITRNAHSMQLNANSTNLIQTQRALDDTRTYRSFGVAEYTERCIMHP